MFLGCWQAFSESAGPVKENLSGIEVYVAGKKFSSFDDYEAKKEQALANNKPEAAEPDPLFGKTLIIGSDGTVITSLSTIDPGKTLTLIPVKEEVRVVGVEPSFKQVVKDFESGEAANGVKPTPVASANQFDEELRKKLRANHRPVLLISDKKKVRVMGLSD